MTLCCELHPSKKGSLVRLHAHHDADGVRIGEEILNERLHLGAGRAPVLAVDRGRGEDDEHGQGGFGQFVPEARDTGRQRCSRPVTHSVSIKGILLFS